MFIPILHRYLWGSVIRGYLPVLSILLAVFSLFVFVEEVDEVGSGRYTFLAAGEYVLLTLPDRFVVLSPFIALLGSIMALGGLANGRELLAMQASGISQFQIAGMVLQVGMVFVLIVGCLEEFVTPTLDQYAHISRSLALSNSQVYQGKQGLWFREDRRYIRIKTLQYGEIPQDIDIFEFNNNGEMKVYYFVEEADVQDPQKWVLKNIQKKIEFKDNIIHFGYAKTKEDYYKLLWRSHLSIVTSNHDFFGISICESVLCDVHTILPNRLAYPEHFNSLDNFYSTREELMNKIKNSIKKSPKNGKNKIRSYNWKKLKQNYYDVFNGLGIKK